jgi:hypothetical protein
VTAALAAASRVLAEHAPALAGECLETALSTWRHERGQEPKRQRSAYVPGDAVAQEIVAACELLIATDEDRFRTRLREMVPAIRERWRPVCAAVARAVPHVGDPTFARAVEGAADAYRAWLEEELRATPFGVSFHPQIWGWGWQIQRRAVDLYYLVQAYPDKFDREGVLCAVNYVLGCHPGSDVSLVSGVGARSLTAAYGVNRADWSYIPGGVASGTNLARPDYPELKDDFPFLWQQSEYVMGGAATYLFCVLAADDLLNG